MRSNGNFCTENGMRTIQNAWTSQAAKSPSIFLKNLAQLLKLRLHYGYRYCPLQKKSTDQNKKCGSIIFLHTSKRNLNISIFLAFELKKFNYFISSPTKAIFQPHLCLDHVNL